MQTIRHLLGQRHLALLICAATLLLKLLLPVGYMIDGSSGRITICSGIAATRMTLEMPGMHGDMPDDRKPKDRGKTEMPCAFSGLSASMMGAIDPIQLAALITFVMALSLIAAIPPTPTRWIYMRPPLRGPPTDL